VRGAHQFGELALEGIYMGSQRCDLVGCERLGDELLLEGPHVRW
jgi:hypothetical protein